MKLSPFVLAVVILAGCTVVPPRPTNVARGDYEATRAHVTKLIRYEMEKKAVPGLSIALVDDQPVVWAEGFGYADVEMKTSAAVETLYRVGSISKLFTVGH